MQYTLWLTLISSSELSSFGIIDGIDGRISELFSFEELFKDPDISKELLVNEISFSFGFSFFT